MQVQHTGCIYLIPSPLSLPTQEALITPQIHQIILNTNYYVVENIRTARRYISSLKTGKIIENLHFFEIGKHSQLSNHTPQIAGFLDKGEHIGVISEAGCPGIADPGADLVAWAHQKNYKIVPLIGPSSIILALMGSGFNGQSFTFHGYLPIEKDQRAQALRSLEKEAHKKKQTQIFIETPFRNQALFEAILNNCQAHTLICVACNLTTKEEFIQTKTVAQWKKQSMDFHKKPCVFLLYL